MPRILEVYEHLGSYHQRTLFEVHPELTFYQLNEDRPLRYSKRTKAGTQERENLLVSRIPGVERVLKETIPRVRHQHLVDSSASLWTARRVLARAVTRLPEDPEWDDQGFRMELLR
jgi:predicted RNase H-like nuclease